MAATEPEVLFPGFHYDAGHAQAIAQGLLEVLRVARQSDVPAMDQLAALGIAAAEVIRGSRLARDPLAIVDGYVAYMLGVLAVRMLQDRF